MGFPFYIPLNSQALLPMDLVFGIDGACVNRKCTMLRSVGFRSICFYCIIG